MCVCVCVCVCVVLRFNAVMVSAVGIIVPEARRAVRFGDASVPALAHTLHELCVRIEQWRSSSGRSGSGGGGAAAAGVYGLCV